VLVAVAVKATEVPLHIAPGGFAAIDTDGVPFAFTTIVILLDIAVVASKIAANDRALRCWGI
jgi:hypothetical protein